MLGTEHLLHRGARIGLHKICVCSFGDCALINTMLGTKHLLHRPICTLQPT